MASRNAWLSIAIAVFGVAWGANQFAPMLRVYTTTVGLSEATVSATFGIYAAGVAPGILFGGPLSDRYGRPAILFPAIGLSVVATLALLGAQTAGPLYVGRLLAGLASGLAFSAGTAWLLALSACAPEGVAGVRNTVALTLGFALGPLLTGLLVDRVSSPLRTPYLPHLAIMAVGMLLVFYVPRNDAAARGRGAETALLDVLKPDLPRGLPWVAPFSFGTAVMAFTVLPVVGTTLTPAMAGILCALTLGIGVATQPVARRIGIANPGRLNRLGLTASTFAFVLGAAYALTAAMPLLYLACIVAGIAYGMNLLYGFLALGHAPRGVRVAQYYVVAYVGFAFPPVIVSIGEHVPISGVLTGFAALAAALTLVSVAPAPAPSSG